MFNPETRVFKNRIKDDIRKQAFTLDFQLSTTKSMTKTKTRGISLCCLSAYSISLLRLPIQATPPSI